MANLHGVLQQLREEYKQKQVELSRLDEAISAVEGLGGLGIPVAASKGQGRRPMSSAARKRIAEAQRKRWARVRGRMPGSKPAGTRKRTFSAAARRRIAAAQKARWARFRAQKK